MAQFISRAVIQERWTKIQSFLKANVYQALAVLNPQNIYYVSGWHLDVEPWERPVVTVIPAQGEPFMILHELSTHHIQMSRERGSIYIDDISFYQERVSTSQRHWNRLQWSELVGYELARRGLSARMAVDSAPGLLNQVTGATFHTEVDLLRSMRLVKHPEELALMRQAAAIADYGQEVFKTLVKPGKLIAQVDAETVLAMRIEGARRYPDSSFAARCFSLTGPDSASPHGTGAGSSRRIEVGHGIVNIIVVTLNDYNVENERTYFVHEYSEVQKRAFECVKEAQEAAIAKCVAGQPMSAVDAAAQTLIEAAGYAGNLFHRTGHGIGLLGHEYPDDIAFNHRPLMAGEVYTIEPGIYIYGVGGFRHDDTVIVGDTPEVITQTPKDIGSMTISA